MDLRTLLFTLTAAGTTAAAAGTAGAVAGLGETVALLEARYPGTVVAIAVDDNGDRPAHYHVDMRFPASGMARLAVDPATLAVTAREPAPLAPGSASLVHAVALVMGAVPGDLLLAELDATNGVPPHYDVDVRLPQGAIARLKVDSTTRQIGWRTPAISD